MRRTFEKAAKKRQARAAEVIAERKGEAAALAGEPEWGEAAYTLRFDAMPEAKQEVSPSNKEPFSVANGVLTVKGHANTYAFLRIPLDVRASGFVVKLRQRSDGGQSWGPAAALWWRRRLACGWGRGAMARFSGYAGGPATRQFA